MTTNFNLTTTFQHDFGLLLKTYRGDLVMAKRMLESIAHFNMERIPVFLLAPERDYDVFKSFLAPGSVDFVAEESIKEPTYSVSEGNAQAGYMNQQIYKLAFGSLGLTRSYLCLDSDGVFVRDFFLHDFIDQPSQMPFTFMLADSELMAEDAYYASTFQPRMKNITKIFEATEVSKGSVFLSIHNFQILQSEFIDDLRQHLFSKLKIQSFKEMLEIVGNEFNWYTQYVRASGRPFAPREPIFKTFHSSRELVRSLYFGLGPQQYARGYVGVCVNSNFQHGRGKKAPLSLASNPSVTSGIYLTLRENLRLLAFSLGGVAVSLAFQFVRTGNRMRRQLLK
jgi:hypothetical protein